VAAGTGGAGVDGAEVDGCCGPIDVVTVGGAARLRWVCAGWDEGAMASTGGREAFFVSVLSHEASNKTAAPRIPMLKRFTRNSMQKISVAIQFESRDSIG
jgi:hypothetical protein